MMAKATKRRIVQLLRVDDDDAVLFALCDDGSLWGVSVEDLLRRRPRWYQVKGPPDQRR